MEKARAVLEADGYVLENGYYTKDGQVLSVTLSSYEARNFDTIALVIMEQLKAFGIQADLKIVEDPDAAYMTGDAYEIGFYRNLTDKSGDPFSFIDAAFRTGTYQDIAGFGNPETDALIEELRYEGDPDRRAELANEIM